MLTADLHALTASRLTYYNRRQDDADPGIVFGPWVTVELFDDGGNNVALFIRNAEEAAVLRDAGASAGHLLATVPDEPDQAEPGEPGPPPKPSTRARGRRSTPAKARAAR